MWELSYSSNGSLIKLPEPHNGVYLINKDTQHILYLDEDDYSQPIIFEGTWPSILEAESIYCMLNETGSNLLIYDSLEGQAAIIRLAETDTVEVVQSAAHVDWNYGSIQAVDYSYSPDLNPSIPMVITGDLSFVVFEQYSLFYKHYRITSSAYN